MKRTSYSVQANLSKSFIRTLAGNSTIPKDKNALKLYNL